MKTKIDNFFCPCSCHKQKGGICCSCDCDYIRLIKNPPKCVTPEMIW